MSASRDVSAAAASTRGQGMFLERIRSRPGMPGPVLRAMEDAARFRLDSGTSDLLLDLFYRDSAKDTATYLFWPSPVTWIEGTLSTTDEEKRPTSVQFGLLFRGDKASSITHGQISYFTDFQSPHFKRRSTAAEFKVNLRESPYLIEEEWSKAYINRYKGLNLEETQQIQTYNVFCLFASILAMLCSRRIYSVRQVGFNKLNAQRAKKGKWPLLAYNEVRISIDDPPPTVTPATGRGSPRPLHFVRAFLRLRLGRIELVSPHWRGDAQLGVKRPAYVITP